MQHEATAPPTLPYGTPPRSRRWRVFAFLIGGSVAQFALLLVLSSYREVRWVDRVAWVLECPLFRIMWDLGLPVTNTNGYALGLLNGLCWSSFAVLVVWLVRRARRAA
ncbi:MAG TPA: hypothetical protein VGN72_15365 [Tepidisphaeraceae bacterium]|jgi:hypothetical protein|nr:hypothetical protein [Tepidisphaeraceae bacterium]